MQTLKNTPKPTRPASSEPNPEAVESFAGLVLNEIGAAANASLVQAGYDLGIFESLSKDGPGTAEEISTRLGLNRRHLLEWLSSQYATGFVEYDPATERFSLTPEQRFVLVDRDSPAYLGGAWSSLTSMYLGAPAITKSIRTGDGVAWGDQCDCLFCGTAEFYRPAYQNSLVQEWIPALKGVKEKLENGADVLDVGCGYGHSTAILAAAFPGSHFTGTDLHAESLEEARKISADRGLGNVRFEEATALDYEGERHDFVTIFDALHDMGNPVAITRHIRKELLKEDGTLMLVEPLAADSLPENRNPMGRAFYAFSTAFCTANALSQLDENESGDALNALGAQAGEARLTEVLRKAGFTRIRRAASGVELMVIEAKP